MLLPTDSPARAKVRKQRLGPFDVEGVAGGHAGKLPLRWLDGSTPDLSTG